MRFPSSASAKLPEGGDVRRSFGEFLTILSPLIGTELPSGGDEWFDSALSAVARPTVPVEVLFRAGYPFELNLIIIFTGYESGRPLHGRAAGSAELGNLPAPDTILFGSVAGRVPDPATEQFQRWLEPYLVISSLDGRRSYVQSVFAQRQERGCKRVFRPLAMRPPSWRPYRCGLGVAAGKGLWACSVSQRL